MNMRRPCAMVNRRPLVLTGWMSPNPKVVCVVVAKYSASMKVNFLSRLNDLLGREA